MSAPGSGVLNDGSWHTVSLYVMSTVLEVRLMDDKCSNGVCKATKAITTAPFDIGSFYIGTVQLDLQVCGNLRLKKILICFEDLFNECQLYKAELCRSWYAFGI